jgi:prepilin-type N-terminal cleavage/methylation domain-containing protein
VICNIFKKDRAKGLSQEKGFTLVEILATFVLIAIILPAVMEGISLSMKLGAKSKRQIEAAALAETKLAEFVLSGDYDSGNQSGEFDDDESGYKWSLEVEDWKEEDSMQQLLMTVDWTDSAGTDHSVSLSTLVYTESESESG